LEAIGEYFDRPSPQYAAAIIERLYTSVEPLAEHPKMGRYIGFVWQDTGDKRL
jgi:plasmid stabilization system protein ParE